MTIYFRALLIAVFLLGAAFPLEAATASWNRNPEPTVTGYRLSYGTQSGVHPTSIDVGNVVTFQFFPPAGQRYFVVVQALNSSGISAKSAEVIYDAPAAQNQPPVLTQPANRSNARNTAASMTLVAVDPEGAAIAYGATGLPPGLTVNAATGAIAGTVTTVGTYTVTASASDGSLITTRAFTWTVTGNQPPTLTQPANQTSAEGATVSLALVASDPNGSALTFSATGLPRGLAINSTTGLISGRPSYTSAGTLSVTATVSDGTLSASRTFSWTVTNTNRAPAFTRPANQTTAEGTAVSLALIASDPDTTPLTFSATGLPAGLTINATSGLISGTPSYTSAGAFSVTATVSDGSLSTSRTFSWTVTNANRAPVFTQPANQTSAAGSDVSIALAATDPDGDALTFTATGLPAGASVNPTTGLISGPSSYTSAGTYSVSATVSDGWLSVSRNFSWIVTNTNRAPVLMPVANQTTAADTDAALQIAASDPDGTAVTYAATGLPPALTISAATGLISGHVDASSAGVHAVTVTVSDGVLSSSTTFVWSIDGTDVPVRGDFDGDGRDDPATYREATGEWRLWLSTSNFVPATPIVWGTSTDITVPADYDGDGRTDIAVYRAATGTWHALLSSTNMQSSLVVQWGNASDRPAALDYDDDGRADLAVPRFGGFEILLSSSNYTSSVTVR